MSFRSDATELSRVLNDIIRTASEGNGEYVSELAARLAPVIARYDHAVFERRSREEASEALTEMAESMSDLSAAATRLELRGFGRRSLDSYWRLCTIFRESKYRDEIL
jgi:hypothetical protein